jgi:hypothetical protein
VCMGVAVWHAAPAYGCQRHWVCAMRAQQLASMQYISWLAVKHILGNVQKSIDSMVLLLSAGQPAALAPAKGCITPCIAQYCRGPIMVQPLCTTWYAPSVCFAVSRLCVAGKHSGHCWATAQGHD